MSLKCSAMASDGTSSPRLKEIPKNPLEFWVGIFVIRGSNIWYLIQYVSRKTVWLLHDASLIARSSSENLYGQYKPRITSAWARRVAATCGTWARIFAGTLEEWWYRQLWKIWKRLPWLLASVMISTGSLAYEALVRDIFERHNMYRIEIINNKGVLLLVGVMLVYDEFQTFHYGWWVRASKSLANIFWLR